MTLFRTKTIQQASNSIYQEAVPPQEPEQFEPEPPAVNPNARKVLF